MKRGGKSTGIEPLLHHFGAKKPGECYDLVQIPALVPLLLHVPAGDGPA